ncbi:hypothetical protein BGX23_001476 [Mortierella sp. AD031]|nr:hypothetical protein BGX23_001476 [Mortierella sp. AD031]
MKIFPDSLLTVVLGSLAMVGLPTAVHIVPTAAAAVVDTNEAPASTQDQQPPAPPQSLLSIILGSHDTNQEDAAKAQENDALGPANTVIKIGAGIPLPPTP